MADPFSSVGWLRHVKGRRECSKVHDVHVSNKQASQRMKKAGKMLAVKQAEALRCELNKAWTDISGGVDEDKK